MKKIVIFASGSGSSAENIIANFNGKTSIKVEKLYCNNQKAFVLERIKKYNINTMIFNNSDLETGKVLEDLIKVRPELIVLAGFLRKIPKAIIDEFKNKIINIHPALLPKYGGQGMFGLNVHQKVIDNKDFHSGFTIHYVNENYDEGNVIFQKKIEVKSSSAEELSKKVLAQEHKYYPTIINSLLNDCDPPLPTILFGLIPILLEFSWKFKIIFNP